MTALRRETIVAAPLETVDTSWPHFVQWVLTGHAKLACDEVVCVNVLQSGTPRFRRHGPQSTRVAFDHDLDELPRAPKETERVLTHGLLAFKDYNERTRDARSQRDLPARGHDGDGRRAGRDSLLDPGEAAAFGRH